MGVVTVDEADSKLRQVGAKVFVDGLIAGYVNEADKMAPELIRMRRAAEISSEVNVAYSPPQVEGGRPELYVNCDQGRVRRPLIIVENSKPTLHP